MPKSNFKKKKANFKQFRQEPKDDKRLGNDPKWYGSDEDIKMVASLPFSTVTGLDVEYFGSNSRRTRQSSAAFALSNNEYGSKIVPGLMVVPFIPVFGNTNTNAMQVAGQSLYSYIRSKISGSRTYEQSDLMIYVGAVDALALYLAHLRKMLYLWNQYRTYNRYLPEKAISLLGGDAADIQANIKQYIFVYNTAVAKVNSLCIPNAFSLLLRHAYLSACVIADDHSAKSQYYFYKPVVSYYYDPTTSQSGGMLVPFACDFSSIASIKTQVNKMINQLVQDDDIGTISGDVKRAFEDANVFTLKPLEVDPMAWNFGDLVLVGDSAKFAGYQLKNCTILPLSAGDATVLQEAFDSGRGHGAFDSLYLTQANNALSQPCTMKITKEQLPSNVVPTDCYVYTYDNGIYVYDDAPTPQDVMEFTRGKINCTVKVTGTASDDGVEIIPLEHGTELFLQPQVYIGSMVGEFSPIISFAGNSNASNMFNMLISMKASIPFRYAPIAFMQSRNSQVNPTETTNFGPVGFFDNYTFVDPGTLERMHYIALLAEYGLLSNTTVAGGRVSTQKGNK